MITAEMDDQGGDTELMTSDDEPDAETAHEADALSEAARGSQKQGEELPMDWILSNNTAKLHVHHTIPIG